MSIRSQWDFFSDEIGLKTILNGSSDVYIIILLRMIRLFIFGASSLILVVFLRELKVPEQLIGIFMTLTFAGDLVTSFLLSLVADKLGRKFSLAFSSSIMTLTALAFAFFDNYYLLTTVAILGILTPGGGEVGPFRSIEQSSIATLAPHNERSDVYAWYTFAGTFCAALGSVASGALIGFVTEKRHYSMLAGYKVTFLCCSGFSLLSVVLSLLISENIELKEEELEEAPQSTTGQLNHTNPSQESTPLLSEPAATSDVVPLKKERRFIGFLPELHQSIYSIVVKLSILFALDSFASSLVSMSWQTYYVKRKFSVSPSLLGTIFFVTGIVSGVMSLLGTSLTKRLGAVVTMVVTHLPASLLLALVPLPTSLGVTLAILVVRASTQSMDVAPKHVFLATLVPAKDRTAVFGWVNVVKTMAQVVGPTITGYLTNVQLQWLTFVIAGSLKAVYDVGILTTFLVYNRHNQH